mmetsp:Transcript_10749/g.13441  ORF Transcript_10749/g.13441 Transcript_10749/m.13441 type:complete len:83 (-) Transcript_10749:45-293(-)
MISLGIDNRLHNCCTFLSRLVQSKFSIYIYLSSYARKDGLYKSGAKALAGLQKSKIYCSAIPCDDRKHNGSKSKPVPSLRKP